MGIDQQIREHVRYFLDGAMSFEEFEDWFLDATWDLHRPDEAAPEIVHTVERYIGEYTGGYRDEATLREDLERLAPAWAVSESSSVESSTGRGHLIPS